MPNPTTPSQFCESVPANNSDLCTKVDKFFGLAQILCDLFSWMFNSDGTFSDEVKAELTAAITPTGIVVASASQNMGSGWLQCDGSAVSRTTYAALFAEVGTRYGTGNGTTTFNLPDLRGRSIIGAGTGDGLTTRDINAPEVGEEDHTQTEDEMPAHTHEITINANDDGGGGSGNSTPDDSGSPVAGNLVHDTEETGGGNPFNVVHPCFVLYWYIKT